MIIEGQTPSQFIAEFPVSFGIDLIKQGSELMSAINDGFDSLIDIDLGTIQHVNIGDKSSNFVSKINHNFVDPSIKSDLNLIFEGHSLMVGTGATLPSDTIPEQTKNALMANNPDRTIVSSITAYGGSFIVDPVTQGSIYDMTYRYNNSVKSKLKGFPYRNILVVFIGTNDLANIYNPNGQSLWNLLKSYATTSKNDGFEVILLTCLKAGARSETERLIYNNLIKNDAPLGVNILDIDIHSEFQNINNTTYFTDTVHLTSAGYTIISNDLIPFIQSLI